MRKQSDVPKWRKFINSVIGLLALGGAVASGPVYAQEEMSDEEAVLAWMHEVNAELEALSEDFRLESIEFFTVGMGRPLFRIHQDGTHWVPGDIRRFASANDITYVVDQSAGNVLFSGPLFNFQTEPAIDRAMGTWAGDRCFEKIEIVKVPDNGSDLTVLDGLLGLGGIGDPFFADIVFAGWPPFFVTILDIIGVPLPDVIAFSATFVFLDGGEPTDVDGDGFLDTAFVEVYFRDPLPPPPLLPAGSVWTIDGDIDVETVALHEGGHAFSIGHFGPPPIAAMNPGYSGIRQETEMIDHAGVCTIWASWPKS